MSEIRDLFRRATTTVEAPEGFESFPYQERVAAEGLPELLEIPTGLGKTLTVVVAWLYRRRFHPDPEVRDGTPQRLVLTFPMRVLVEQSGDVIVSVLEGLGLKEDVDVFTLMGGEPLTGPDDWRSAPERDSIVVATVDMVLSRCLMRGYGASRYSWPIDFGLLHEGSHFVFDEVQLLGPALATARQLHAFRATYGTYLASRSTYMSATVDRARLDTVDADPITHVIELNEDDRRHPAVRRRLQAPKRIEELDVGTAKNPLRSVADHLVDHHRSGTLTLAVLNTVDRATEVYTHVARAKPDAEVILLHSRFRPADRAGVVSRAVAPVDHDGPGRIVISTQVVEAGVDISSALLVTDAAPWSSIVQRAGRCNRYGERDDAVIRWVAIDGKKAAPYESTDVATTATALRAVEGSVLTPAVMDAMEVDEIRPLVSVLRRRDFEELFDTTADVSGNDIDVARFIRDGDDLDVAVSWRLSVDADHHGRDRSTPGRGERCPVPVPSFRDWLKKLDSKARTRVRRWSVPDAAWVRCELDDVRPGVAILVASALGGYTPDLGWAPKSKAAVESIVDHPPAERDDLSPGDDPITAGSNWVTLPDHLDDTAGQAATLATQLKLTVPPSHRQAVVDAAAFHDIGKAHAVFQGSVRKVAAAVGASLPSEVVFAKTASAGTRFRHERPGFRHELVSALWLLAVQPELPSDDLDLVTYLVAAHHGRVRLGIRALPQDNSRDVLTVLGVSEGDSLDALTLSTGTLPGFAVDLDLVALGRGAAGRSWTERALDLVNRADLGPFRLAFLEAVVRQSDFRASAAPTPYQLEDDHA